MAIVRVNWANHAVRFMGCKQPLDVCTGERNALERKRTALGVESSCSAFS
jgi:hypothetical protein